MKDHLTEEDIAVFIEERYSEIDKARVCSHLQCCESCFIEYINAMRWRGILGSNPEEFKSSNDLIEAGLGLALKAGSQPSGRSAWRTITKRTLRWWQWQRIAVTAAFIVLIMGVLWISPINQGNDNFLALNVVGPIQDAIESSSSHSLIVIPGTEWSLNASSSIKRSGFIPETDTLSTSLQKLIKLYDEEPQSRDVLCWLIKGFMADGQLDVAQQYSLESFRLYPDDTEIILLRALVAYFAGEIDVSEKYLRELLEDRPDNVVAQMNLGVILKEQERYDEAFHFFKAIQNNYPGTPLALRARRLINNN